MTTILTFTNAENEDLINIIKEKIIAYRRDRARPNTTVIFTNFQVPFLVRETPEEIYNAINDIVENDPTDDFI